MSGDQNTISSPEPYEEKIARLRDDGYELCVVATKDTLGHEHDYLFMRKKMVDGKLDWIEIGPLDDEKIESLIDIGTTLVTLLDEDGVPIGLPVASLEPTNPLTHSPAPPAHVAPAPREEAKTLEKELLQYKIDGWRFRVRKMSGAPRLSVRKIVDGKEKEHYIGSYDRHLKKLCDALGIKISGVRIKN